MQATCRKSRAPCVDGRRCPPRASAWSAVDSFAHAHELLPIRQTCTSNLTTWHDSQVGTNIAASGHYFMQFLIISFATSPLLLLRIIALLKFAWVKPALPAAEPVVPYGAIVPKLLLTLLVAYTYMIIAPLLVPVALGSFVVQHSAFRYLFVFNHMPQYESGGKFWYITFHRIVLGLTLSNCFVIMALYLKDGVAHSFWLMPLPPICYFFGRYCHHAYELPSQTLSWADARKQDDSFMAGVAEEFGEPLTAGFDPFLYSQPAVRHSVEFEGDAEVTKGGLGGRGRHKQAELPSVLSVAGSGGTASYL